jgi:tripeptide aminopeptidase
MNTPEIILKADLRPYVLPRFLRYVRVWTTSDSHCDETPSTPQQWDLAKILAEELKTLGIEDVVLTEHCYVIARLPASPGREKAPALGLLAHIDTSPDVSGKDVRPVVVEAYDGSLIRLGEGLVLDPSSDADLAAQKGKTIIHSAGDTLLGADDKAGIAEIMGAAEFLIKHPEIGHGPIEIIFSPDEETGRGLPCLPLETLKAQVCYTVDGGPLGRLEAECFNAWGAEITFTGKVIHLGTARGALANAVSMAASYAAMLPRSESPESTDGYYGYYCPLEIQGNLESASLQVFLRDFEKDGIERRIKALESFAGAVEAQFPGGRVSVVPKLQYLNMKEKIGEKPKVMALLEKAAAALGISVVQEPIRGGTDGSRLTELGIPTPNIFTGGRNAHSRIEWASAGDMFAAARLVLELARLWGCEA